MRIKAKEESLQIAVSTSEKLNNISPQPEEACTMIDSVIKEIYAISNNSDKPRSGWDNEEVEGVLWQINWDVSGLSGDMEKIRTRIEEVRSWGQEWKDLAKSLID